MLQVVYRKFYVGCFFHNFLLKFEKCNMFLQKHFPKNVTSSIPQILRFVNVFYVFLQNICKKSPLVLHPNARTYSK